VFFNFQADLLSMANRITSLWESFYHTIRGIDSPGQLATGISLGMIVGLMPKDSLLPYCLIVLLLFSRANLLCAVFAAMVFSWLGPLLDPVSHAIGVSVLTFAPLESTWAWLIQLPVIPWTRFDNSIVMGSLVMGLLAAYPLYRISRHVFDVYGNAMFNRWRKTRLALWLIGPSKRRMTEGTA
jgi:uncharacterized protein (TIGR03546 family)